MLNLLNFKGGGQNETIPKRQKHMQSPQGRRAHDTFKDFKGENTVATV